MSNNPATSPSDVYWPDDRDRYGVRAFLPAWELADIEPAWPVSRTTLVSLLNALHYEVNDALIQDWINRGRIPEPERHNGTYAFSPHKANALRALLDNEERWRVCPSFHDQRKTALRLMAEQALIGGNIEELEQGTRDTPYEDLLAWIVDADDKQKRRELRDFLWAKLVVAAARLQQQSGESEDPFGLGLDQWRETVD